MPVQKGLSGVVFPSERPRHAEVSWLPEPWLPILVVPVGRWWSSVGVWSWLSALQYLDLALQGLAR